MRNVFLTLGAICFLAMISGIVVHVHLAHVDKPAEHDGAHCSLCQQLAFSKQDYTTDLDGTNIEIAPVVRVARCCPTEPFHLILPSQSHPRAPPA
jgi:hypothetical protein